MMVEDLYRLVNAVPESEWADVARTIPQALETIYRQMRIAGNRIRTEAIEQKVVCRITLFKLNQR